MSDRRGRLLIVLHDELMNGASISILRAIPHLRSFGWEPSVWCPRPGPAWDHLAASDMPVEGATRPIVSGLQALRQPPGALRRIAATPTYLRRFRAFVQQTRPDVVHSNSLYSFAEAIAASRMGLPTLLHLHDMAPESRKGGVAKRICRDSVDLSVAASEACANSYALGSWRPDVIYEAAPVPAEVHATRERPSPFVVGTVGVISRRKGSDVFVAAARKLKGADVELRMVGSATDPLDAAWAEGVLTEARSSGIIHTPRADVAAELERWDAFALPSRRDPCPISLLEAMALGLPCIGASVDGIPEQLGDGAGLLVRPDDSGDLAAAIGHVAAMGASDRRALGHVARQRVIERFTVERQADALDGAYLRTIAARRGW